MLFEQNIASNVTYCGFEGAKKSTKANSGENI